MNRMELDLSRHLSDKLGKACVDSHRLGLPMMFITAVVVKNAAQVIALYLHMTADNGTKLSKKDIHRAILKLLVDTLVATDVSQRGAETALGLKLIETLREE